MLVVTGRVGRSIATPRTDGDVAALLDSAVPDEGATRATVVSASGAARVTLSIAELAGSRIVSGCLVGPSGPEPSLGPRPGGDEWIPEHRAAHDPAAVLVDDVARIEIA